MEAPANPGSTLSLLPPSSSSLFSSLSLLGLISSLENSLECLFFSHIQRKIAFLCADVFESNTSSSSSTPLFSLLQWFSHILLPFLELLVKYEGEEEGRREERMQSDEREDYIYHGTRILIGGQEEKRMERKENGGENGMYWKMMKKLKFYLYESFADLRFPFFLSLSLFCSLSSKLLTYFYLTYLFLVQNNLLIDSLVLNRTSELFDIIGLYPDSLSSLLDLRVALQNTDMYTNLIRSIRDAFTRRLLRPDVPTSVILTHFFSTIRSMYVLDGSGVLLEKVM